MLSLSGLDKLMSGKEKIGATSIGNDAATAILPKLPTVTEAGKQTSAEGVR
jgi:hypothetical protein